MGRKFLGPAGPSFDTGPGESHPSRPHGFRPIFVVASTLTTIEIRSGDSSSGFRGRSAAS